MFLEASGITFKSRCKTEKEERFQEKFQIETMNTDNLLYPSVYSIVLIEE